jgi:serine/threonine protein kinase
MSRLSPGHVVAGKLRVLDLLGVGSMGSVYAVEHLTLRNRQAMKVLLPELARRPEHVERFLREGVAISRVRHRAVVQVFDAGQDQGLPWLAMELLEGETLKSRIQRGGITAAEIVSIVIEVLGGLVVAHGQGIVHRDLKPSNIFLARMPDGSVQPKILDFGVALVLDVNERITQVGTTMGSVQYMAPEQLHASRDVDARADIYSLGAILFEALSGRTPHRATSVSELVHELSYSPPPDLRMAVQHPPQWLADVVNQSLARERERRPADARALVSLLAAGYPSLAAAPKRPVAGTMVMPSSSDGSLPGAMRPGSSPQTPAPGWGSQPGSNPQQHTPAPSWNGSSPGSWQQPPSGGWAQQPSYPSQDPALLFAQPRPSPLRHLLWAAPLIGLAIVAGAFGVWIILDKERDDDDEDHRVAQTTTVVSGQQQQQPLQQPPQQQQQQQQQQAMLPMEPQAQVPQVPPVIPENVPALAPEPVALGSGHPCIGRWRGALLQSDGQRASCTLNVDEASGSCGGFVERWQSGSVCHYRFRNCSTSGNVLTARASTPRHEQCSPVNMRLTCENGQMRFYESAPGVTVTSTMSRAEP